MLYKIEPIIVGSFGYVRDDILFEGGDPNISRMVPSYIYHVSTPGHSYIVDTSFSSPEKCISLMGLRCERDGNLREILKMNNVHAEYVEMVILTHLHWDHSGNIGLFPNARVICQRADFDYFMKDKSVHKEYKEELVEVANRFTFVEGDVKIEDDITVTLVGGHTPGSEMITIQTENGQVIIPGDVVMLYDNIVHNTPVGLSINPEQSRKAIEKIAQSGCTVFPSHDWI